MLCIYEYHIHLTLIRFLILQNMLMKSFLFKILVSKLRMRPKFLEWTENVRGTTFLFDSDGHSEKESWSKAMYSQHLCDWCCISMSSTLIKVALEKMFYLWYSEGLVSKYRSSINFSASPTFVRRRTFSHKTYMNILFSVFGWNIP